MRSLRRKKGGLIKLLIPVGALLVGVMFADKIQPMVEKIPFLGGMIKKNDSPSVED